VGWFGSGERKQELFLAVVGIFLSAQTQKHTHTHIHTARDRITKDI
jgi:hypothetical protein